jgi:YVTN family beta-propeller protein
MGFSADGRKLYVACGRSSSVHVIDVQTRQVITEIAVGKLPWGVVAH